MSIEDVANMTIGRVLADRAETEGDRPFIRWKNDVYSYAEVEQLTNSYANGFASLGITKGDHVAVILPNCPEILWTIWALGKLGAVVVPINTGAKGELLRYFINQSSSISVVVGMQAAEHLGAVADAFPAVRSFFALSDEPDSIADAIPGSRPVHDLRSLKDASDAQPPLDQTAASDPHLIMYSSGTTGRSKGAISPHSQGHSVGYKVAQAMNYGREDVLYTCLPLFHVNALWYSTYAALWASACVAVSPGFSASNFWDEVRQSNATAFNSLGAMANILWKLPPSEVDRQHSVRLCLMVPAPREMHEGFRERYGIAVTSLYAATETYPVTIFGLADPAEKAGSAGKAPGYSDVRIVDENDKPLDPGAVGEICVRPLEPGIMMRGYYQMPDVTVQSTQNLWFHTGDRGYLDEDGYLFFVDRIKEVIRRRGENISAYELELLLCRHPKIAEAAAIPVPSELGEDEVMVYVVLAAGEDLPYGELVSFCNDTMPYFMVPRFVEYLPQLPKTPSEKIEKYKLKERALETLSQVWDREKAGIRLKK